MRNSIFHQNYKYFFAQVQLVLMIKLAVIMTYPMIMMTVVTMVMMQYLLMMVVKKQWLKVMNKLTPVNCR